MGNRYRFLYTCGTP